MLLHIFAVDTIDWEVFQASMELLVSGDMKALNINGVDGRLRLQVRYENETFEVIMHRASKPPVSQFFNLIHLSYALNFIRTESDRSLLGARRLDDLLRVARTPAQSRPVHWSQR